MMKKLILLLALPVIAGCATFRGNTSATMDDAQDVASMETVSPITKSSQEMDGTRNAFALNFFRTAFASQNNKDENLVISPFSAAEAVSMLMEGAAGETKEEILSALSGTSLAGVSPKSDEYVTISSANSLWLKNGYSLNADYKKLMETAYSAQVYQRNFASKSTVGEINSWCSKHTNGKIPSIIDQISPDMMLFILNALYFNAPWQSEFKKNDTFPQTFYGSKGDVKTEFMHQSKNYQYTALDGNQIVMLPYKGGKYGMLVILPSKNGSLEEVIPTLDSEYLSKIKSSFGSMKVDLSLPKFKIEAELVLNSILQDMGIKKAFLNDADFSAMTTSPVAVDQVKQKVFIDVSEKGTEAAAVTSVGIRLTSVAPETVSVAMNVNRPFAFFIMDRTTDDILFSGSIRNIK